MTDKDVAIWQAKEAFVGDGKTIQVGDTVAAGDPLLKGRGIFFQPFEPTYDHKRDTAARDAVLAAQREAEAKAEEEAKEAVTYAELQAEAKALGIPATGKREELADAVEAAKAEAAEAPEPEAAEAGETPETPAEPAPSGEEPG
jgi:hypothetical protein